MHFPIPRTPHILIPLAGLALVLSVSGDPPNRPTWWTDGISPVITTAATENNQGPANIGQAKHMARAALLALRTSGQTQIADAIEAVLVGPPVVGSPSLSPPLASWDPPTSPAEQEKQKAPLLLGQLKAIAHPFYNQLHAAAPTWLATERATNGTNHPGSIFPWTAETTDDQNKAIATIGQLKAVFSLRFTQDTDTDGLPDLWEIANFANLNQGANGDTDGDSIFNLVEFQNGTNPNNADTDGDGLSDGWEIAHNLDPNDDGTTDPNNGPDGDPDGDSLTNAAELALGTNPNKRDSDEDGVSDWDEVMANSTNPLTATDADEDGIPDDFEKHLARQLLASQPDPAAWGTYHAGLAAGDLTAAHDYTGENITAGQLAGLLRGAPTDIPSSAAYLVEAQWRRNSIPWAYYIPPRLSWPASNVGTYWHSRPDDYDAKQDIVPWADFTLASLSQYLVSRIDSVEWGKYGFTNWDPELAFYWSDAMSGIIESPEPYFELTATKYQGTIIQRKFRVIATRADHEALSQQFLKVTSKLRYYDWGIGEVISVEPFPIKIPKGKFFSDWFNFAVNMTNGVHTTARLLPVEFEYFKPDTNSDQQWQDPSNKMAWSSLYTFDAPKNESLKFKVKAGGVILTPAILDLIEIEVARHAGDPAHPPTWAKYKLSEIGRISADKKEAWCTISAADMISKVKIPAVGSAIRNASMDWIADPAISSFSDSNFVDGWWKPRPNSYPLVNAKGVGNSSATTIKDPSGEDILAYKAKSNREYLISGGAMYTALRLAGGSGETRALCHETADWLYLSVHGWHSANGSYPSGCIETVDANGAGQREFVIPSDVNWSGVKFVIIAGCSVLDINDYNEFYSGGDHTDSPGKRWAATGPDLLLGYNQGGPSDKNGGEIIIDRFYSSNPVVANDEAKVIEWKAANAAEKAWNACAIIPSVAYYYFDYNKILGGTLTAEWISVPKASW